MGPQLSGRQRRWRAPLPDATNTRRKPAANGWPTTVFHLGPKWHRPPRRSSGPIKQQQQQANESSGQYSNDQRQQQQQQEEGNKRKRADVLGGKQNIKADSRKKVRTTFSPSSIDRHPFVSCPGLSSTFVLLRSVPSGRRRSATFRSRQQLRRDPIIHPPDSSTFSLSQLFLFSFLK